MQYILNSSFEQSEVQTVESIHLYLRHAIIYTYINEKSVVAFYSFTLLKIFMLYKYNRILVCRKFKTLKKAQKPPICKLSSYPQSINIYNSFV